MEAGRGPRPQGSSWEASRPQGDAGPVSPGLLGSSLWLLSGGGLEAVEEEKESWRKEQQQEHRCLSSPAREPDALAGSQPSPWVRPPLAAGQLVHKALLLAPSLLCLTSLPHWCLLVSLPTWCLLTCPTGSSQPVGPKRVPSTQ